MCGSFRKTPDTVKCVKVSKNLLPLSNVWKFPKHSWHCQMCESFQKKLLPLLNVWKFPKNSCHCQMCESFQNNSCHCQMCESFQKTPATVKCVKVSKTLLTLSNVWKFPKNSCNCQICESFRKTVCESFQKRMFPWLVQNVCRLFSEQNYKCSLFL